MKSRSASLNLKCLGMKENLSYEDKNRLYILELLEKQLSKKWFISALKLNFMWKKHVKIYGD